MREIKLENRWNGQAFAYTRKAAYYETDQMGIIHHSNYIRWFEEARLAYMESIGLNYREIEERKIIIPVISASCRYRKAVHFDDTVDIYPKMTAFNAVKFAIAYRVLDHETGELMAEGETEHCFLDSEMRLFRLKKEAPDIYECLKACLEENVNA